MSKLAAFGQVLVAALAPRQKTLNTVPTMGRGGWHRILEANTGFWQRNIEISRAAVDTFHADFACKTLIARDVGKLGVKLMRLVRNDVWSEVVVDERYTPVLQRPNHYQVVPQFFEHWMLSKLSRGNTYVLKERDNLRNVAALYVLNPDRVTPLVADDGSTFYRLDTDTLNGLPSQVTVPGSEIIHDRFNCLFHPLVGVPPVYAAGLAAMQGLSIQNQSALLFRNNSQPGGILTAPGEIGDSDVERIKTEFEQKFGGNNIGRTAVLGSGLKYETVAMTAEEAQLIDQLKWTAEVVASAYHVPGYKIGVGARPAYSNSQQNEEYFSSAIQSLIEDAEACLDEGLGIGKRVGLRVEFDIDNLIRMDGAAQTEATTKLVRGGVMTPNEARARFNLPPLEGGDTVYMQQQDIPMSVAASQTVHPGMAAPAAPAKAALPTGRTIRPAASGKTADAEIEPAERETPPVASPDSVAVVVHLKGELNEAMSDHIVREFKAAAGKPIVLVINSDGGIIGTAAHICTLIEDHDACVTTVVQQKAHSAAALVAMAGDRRLMFEGASMMVHNATTNGVPAIAGTELAAKAMADYSGWRPSIIRGWMNKASEFDAGEANRAGFVDAVVTDDWSSDRPMSAYPKRPRAKWLEAYRRTDAQVEKWISEGLGQ